MLLYDILNIQSDSSIEVIEKAYRSKLNDDAEKKEGSLLFYSMSYFLLRNPEKKRFYDNFGDRSISFLLEDEDNWGMLQLYSPFNANIFKLFILLNSVLVVLNFFFSLFSPSLLPLVFVFLVVSNLIIISACGLMNLKNFNNKKEESITIESLKMIVVNCMIFHIISLLSFKDNILYHILYPLVSITNVIYSCTSIINYSLQEKLRCYEKKYDYLYFFHNFVTLNMINYDYIVLTLLLQILCFLLIKIVLEINAFIFLEFIILIFIIPITTYYTKYIDNMVMKIIISAFICSYLIYFLKKNLRIFNWNGILQKDITEDDSSYELV